MREMLNDNMVYTVLHSLEFRNGVELLGEAVNDCAHLQNPSALLQLYLLRVPHWLALSVELPGLSSHNR